MLQVLVIADLHADHWRARGEDPILDVDLDNIDALILAGDISNKGHVQWRFAIEELSNRIEPNKIFLMPGNHDYYGGKIDREDKLYETARKAGANFVQKSVLVFGNTRFLCCTLWTDMHLGGGPIDQNLENADRRMNDHKAIRIASDGYRKFSSLHAARLHHDHRLWLGEQLATPFVGKTIVVTHHAPLPDCIHNDDWSDVPCCYASDLSELIQRYQPDVWLHGHTHVPTNLTLGSTRISNVSIGYPGKRDSGRERADLALGLIECEDNSEQD